MAVGTEASHERKGMYINYNFKYFFVCLQNKIYTSYLFTIYSGDSEKFVMATPSTSPPEHVKVSVTLSGDAISHADINLKLPRPGEIYFDLTIFFSSLQYFDFTIFYRWKRSLYQYFYS